MRRVYSVHITSDQYCRFCPHGVPRYVFGCPSGDFSRGYFHPICAKRVGVI
ncbi:hypothetical protein Hanom_Chr09g00806811 [Helianthus anomalus]